MEGRDGKNVKPVLNAETKKANNKALSPADELKKFHELKESGVITEEEFNKKKKQLLGQ